MYYAITLNFVYSYNDIFSKAIKLVGQLRFFYT